MGMSSHVTGVRDLDGKFADMVALKLACEKAAIPYPPEVVAYFKQEAGEDVDYLRREMETVDISVAVIKCKMETVDISVAVIKCNRESTDCFEVNLAKLPKECKAIRFENSW